MLQDPLVVILMYFVLPLWLAAGFADWLCHRASHIETTSGAKESLIHLLMFAEVGLPLLAAIFLQVNAGIIMLMIIAFCLHEATALWDVSYAITLRTVSPLEQHIHSLLEMIPLMSLIWVIVLHWSQFEALFGFGSEAAQFGVSLKDEPLPVAYVLTLMGAILVFELLPYLEELLRGVRAAGRTGRRKPAAASRNRIQRRRARVAPPTRTNA